MQALVLTTREQCAYIRSMVDDMEITDTQIELYLQQAKSAVFDRLYAAYATPPDGAEVPERYLPLALQLAARYIVRRGAEGELSHSEGGVSRAWSSADDADLLNRVTPLVGMLL